MALGRPLGADGRSPAFWVADAMLTHQLALLAPPVLLLSAWLLWLTRTWIPVTRIAALLAWLAFVWITFGAGPRQAPPAAMLLATPESDELWTFTLQAPEQRIVRRQPIGAFASDALLVARYVWDAGAAPETSRRPLVFARVNGSDLPPLSAGDDADDYWCCTLRWSVPAQVVLRAPEAEIEIWLPVRDPRVRFIAQRNAGAARLGVHGSHFFDGSALRPGVPHTHSASVRPGFLHVWLEAVT